MLKKVLILLVVVLSVALILGGCSSTPAAPTTSAAPPATSAPATSSVPATSAPPATTSAPNTSTSPAATQTLKIGLIGWLGWPLGLDMMRGDEVLADQINKAGGLDVGGTRYQIKLIEYDSKNDQPTAVAAANKLIFQDKVQYITADSHFVDAWLPIAEANKVLALVQEESQLAESPQNHYTFNASFLNAQNCVLPGWYAAQHPEQNTVAVALPDTQSGHSQGPVVEASWKVFGYTPTIFYYPAGQQDQSALGTKVKTLNPALFTALAGGPVGDGLCFKAVYQAGYKGTFIASNPNPFGNLEQVIPPEALEGFIDYAYPVYYDPALTPIGQSFRNDYIAKFGKWDNPDPSETALFTCLIAAMQKANSIDPTKLADVIGNGLQWEGPTGQAQMISRPDLGNDRTVDSMLSYYVQQMQNGKPTIIGHISIEDGIKYFREAFPTK